MLSNAGERSGAVLRGGCGPAAGRPLSMAGDVPSARGSGSVFATGRTAALPE